VPRIGTTPGELVGLRLALAGFADHISEGSAAVSTVWTEDPLNIPKHQQHRVARVSSNAGKAARYRAGDRWRIALANRHYVRRMKPSAADVMCGLR
jgi:hypothetical protein